MPRTFTIERNIPPPSAITDTEDGAALRDTLLRMEVGDSVLTDSMSLKKMIKLEPNFLFRNFESRPEAGQQRIWRIV